MATYYLNADTGSDSNSGTEASPWLTMTKAEASSTTNDIIICQNSTAEYNFPTVNFGHTLTIRGEKEDASGAVFDGGSASRNWNLATSGITLTVEKITIKDLASTAGALKFEQSNQTAVVDQCKFHDISLSGTGISGVIACGGLSAARTNPTMTVTNSFFRDITAVSGSTGVISNRLPSGTTMTITGNTFYIGTASNPIDSIIHVDSGGGTLTAKNNVFYDVDNNTLDAVDEGTLTFAPSYNCYYQTTDEGGTGSITDDPLFADIANDNTNPQTTPTESPLILAGINV